jgi:hypothetical protein
MFEMHWICCLNVALPVLIADHNNHCRLKIVLCCVNMLLYASYDSWVPSEGEKGVLLQIASSKERSGSIGSLAY